MTTSTAVEVAVGGRAGVLSDDELADAICGFAARLAAASCAWILAIAEYDRREAWRAWGCKSMVHWLSWKCAMGPVAAREHVRVGAALASLPLTREQFGAGRLSYSQVRALSRVATADTEAQWVGLARSMTVPSWRPWPAANGGPRPTPPMPRPPPRPGGACSGAPRATAPSPSLPACRPRTRPWSSKR